MAKIPWTSRDLGLEDRRFVMQKALVEKHFPCFKCQLLHRRLSCEGFITPSDDCSTYKVSISYKQNGVPRVRIREPRIEPSSDIHMYGDGSLCLFQPEETPWKVSNNIHDKIIPWTAEWLVFYELFLICGKWLGPEAPHNLNSKISQTSGSGIRR